MSPPSLPPQDRRPALRPPQFRLSTLLGVIGAVCAVLAAMKFVGPIGAFALLLLLLSVVAHISGNALGTRLRSFGDQPVDEEDRPLARAPQYLRVAKPPAPTRLTERRKMGLLLLGIVVTMIVAGVCGGGWWTLHSTNPPPTAQDVALSATAFGVLGGILGLIVGGFVVVGAGAWREALRGGENSDPPPWTP